MKNKPDYCLPKGAIVDVQGNRLIATTNDDGGISIISTAFGPLHELDRFTVQEWSAILDAGVQQTDGALAINW